MIKVHVPIPNNEYDVFIENGILNTIENYIDISQKYVVITDSNVAPLYLEKITSKLLDYQRYIIPPGEHSKSMEMAYSLINKMINDNVTRDYTVLSLGGGVVGDLSGFIASIYMRGIKYIQVPTTLLSQIDSSVGGKVGINSEKMKNAIGNFLQPIKVIIDPTTLHTLPKREISSGMAEMIKYAIIKSKPLFNDIQKDFDIADISQKIATCVTIKSNIVRNDVYDLKERQLLNFGHTIGHAIEQYYNYSITHGEAVAIGMVKMSVGKPYYDTLLELLNKYDLPSTIEYDKDKIFTFITTDKKVTSNTLNIVLAESVGNGYIKPINLTEIKAYL